MADDAPQACGGHAVVAFHVLRGARPLERVAHPFGASPWERVLWATLIKAYLDPDAVAPGTVVDVGRGARVTVRGHAAVDDGSHDACARLFALTLPDGSPHVALLAPAADGARRPIADRLDAWMRPADRPLPRSWSAPAPPAPPAPPASCMGLYELVPVTDPRSGAVAVRPTERPVLIVSRASGRCAEPTWLPPRSPLRGVLGEFARFRFCGGSHRFGKVRLPVAFRDEGSTQRALLLRSAADAGDHCAEHVIVHSEDGPGAPLRPKTYLSVVYGDGDGGASTGQRCGAPATATVATACGAHVNADTYGVWLQSMLHDLIDRPPAHLDPWWLAKLTEWASPDEKN